MEISHKQLSRDRIEELKEAFDLFDENGNGSISIQELAQIFKSIGHYPSLDELRDMLNEDNKDESLEEKKIDVTFREFLKLMNNKSKDDDLRRELKEAFKILDKDGHGLIDITELKETLLSFGENLAPDELEILLREADDDNDGYIEYEIFIDKIIH